EGAATGFVAFDFVAWRAGVAAHHSDGFLETGWRRKPNTANPRPADRNDRAAVFCAFGDGSVDAAMVQPDQSRRIALPALCAFHGRFAARAADVSVLLRTPFHPRDAGEAVAIRLACLCGMLRRVRHQALAGIAHRSWIGSAKGASRFERRASFVAAATTALAA